MAVDPLVALLAVSALAGCIVLGRAGHPIAAVIITALCVGLFAFERRLWLRGL